MMNNILRSDYNEYIQNRNVAKIQFLQHEISQYQDLNKQLKDVLTLKKKSLEIINSKSPVQQLQQPSHGRMNSTKEQVSSSILPPQYRNQNKDELLQKLCEENKRLLNTFKVVSQERNIAQSKALINQQVAEEVENFQQDILQEQEDQLLELRRIVQDKEYTVQEFEKQKPKILPGGVIIKYRDIVAPAEQMTKLQGLYDCYSAAAQVLKKQSEYLIDLNRKTEIENEFAIFELIKLKSLLHNPTSVHTLKSSAQIHAKTQSSKESLLFRQKPDAATLYHETEELRKKIFKSAALASSSEKTQQSGNKTNRPEEEWEKVRKNFDRELLNDRLLSEQLSQAETYNQTLMQTNELILNSNQAHQKQIEKLQQNIGFYHEYHKKLLKIQEKMKSGSASKSSFAGTVAGIAGSLHSFQDLSISKPPPTSTKSKVGGLHKSAQFQQSQIGLKEKPGQSLGVSTVLQNGSLVHSIHIQNSNNINKINQHQALNRSLDHGNVKDLLGDEEEPAWELQECKQFLRNLAEDFYASLSNTQKSILSRKIISNVSQEGGIGFQFNTTRVQRVRSLSNLLDYKRHRMEPQKLANSQAPHYKYLNTEYNEPNQLQFRYDTANQSPNHTEFTENTHQLQQQQPGDISVFLENGVDFSCELRPKQKTNFNGEPIKDSAVFSGSNQSNNAPGSKNFLPPSVIQGQKASGSHQLEKQMSSASNNKSNNNNSRLQSGHSKKKSSVQLNTKIPVKLGQNENNNNNFIDEQQSFISNDDILNQQILSSQNDVIFSRPDDKQKKL